MIYRSKDIKIAQLFCQGDVSKFCKVYKSFSKIVNNRNDAHMRAIRICMAMVVEWGHDAMYK
jgi:hypothetical protein